MAQSIILILLCFIDSCDTQWQTNQNYLSSNQIFTDQTEDFVLPFSTTQAQFITCTTPATSYMTLNSTKPSANYLKKQFYFDGSFINFDLFFQGTWSNEFIIFTIGDTFLYKYLYISPQNYPITQGFCDNLIVDVKSINFTLTNTIQDKIQFTSTGQGDAQVSIKNVIVSRHICFPSCSSCTGPKFNQCTNCYYGSVTNNICPPCSSNQYYMKYQGCKDICDIYSPIVYKGFCQSYPISKIFSFEFQSSNPLHPENMKWSIIYDLLNIDASPKPQQINRYLYGIFKFNSGIYRFFNQLSTYSFSTYLIGLKISILLFYDIPLNCGIQFKINDVYSGSIYRNASGIQTHKLKIFQTQLYDSYLNYSLRKSYDLITYLNIPKSQIVFSAIGNYTDDTAGWGMVSIEFTSGYCPQYCNLCEVSFKCKTCQNGYYMYRDGSCISNCSSSYQKLIDLYCYDYDDETPYSQYLIQEYTNLATDPDQYQQYTLIFQEGSNFLKGLDIYYSYWQEYRVFGGPFVWAQAKFQRIHEIIDPHHSITIGFYIIYGPQFPSDGGFIYTIQNNTPVTKSSSAYHSLYSDGSKDDKIYERIVHNTNNLIISWECFGKNNEPVYAYCGFYNYYIAVHYCQPYCLSCQDQNKCTLWNSSYDSKIVRFSQEECLNTQYFDRDSFQCLQCLLPCLTCKSKIDCLTCVSTYTKTKLGCICKINQYEDKNQCFNCPNECNQCLSQTYCIECLISNNRKLINGQCNCIDGYYSIISNPQCQLCDQFCKTCFGPTFNDCLTCSNIINIEIIGTTCRCPIGSYYDDALRTCSQCHQSCLTCYKNTINSCLTCNPTLNRILKGLVCECAPGYYDLNNICANCPINEDKTLNQCYKYCNNNQSIWYSIICNSCDPGFQLISGECQPICGDLQIKGYEQCDNNSNLIDLCYNCQFKCPIHCQTCNETTTLPCPDICGDGIITGIEECEDGNTIQYDGCFDCKYQCQPECTKCIKGECFECANRGQYISQQLLHGYAKINVEIQSKLEMNNVKITIKMIQMDAKIVNIIVELVVPLVIITQKLVQVVNYLGLLLMNIIVKIFVEMGQLLLILMDFIKNNVMMEIQLIMMVVVINVNINVNHLQYAQIVLIIDVKYVLKDTTFQNLKFAILCVKSIIYCLIKDAKITNHIVRFPVLFVIQMIVTYDEQCDDGNLIYGDGCHFCQFTCQDSCLNCIQGICYYCQEGYQLIQSKCLPICGDGVKANDEQCEIVDQSLIVFRCLNCKYECDINCQICLFGICQICQVGYFMSSNKQICNLDYLSKISENNFKCNDYCLSCVNGICGLCFEGRYLFNDECIQMNLQNGIYVDVSSLDSCGDFKININEECEDNNINPFLSCLNCKFQCDFYCINCLFGKCQGCQFGYIVNDNFKCQPECGDGIVVPFQDEQCDIQDDGCLNCKFKCQPYCIKCDLHYCFECETGYQVDQLNLNFCILASFCGDGVIDQEFEDCDDQNDKPYDGCFQCKFQCESNCQECQQGICQKDICSSGTIWRNNSCISIVIDNCEIQEEGNCISCKTKYDLINNQCVLTKNNNLNTESSNNYLCRESECAFSKSPYMSLLFLNQTFALQFVQVNFDQQVRLNNNNSNQKQAFNISILNLDESYYSISVIPIQEFSFDLQFVQYEIIIKFLLSFETKPILQLQLNQEIVNSYNQKIDQYIQSISLQQPIIISEQDKQSSFQLQKYNKGLMIGTISICFLCLFSQGFIFVETLNFLQYQSFLRFINVEYPENLFIYYQAQEMLSIDNYLEFLYINEYLEILTGKDQTIKSNGKLQLFNIEVDLLTHIFPQFLQVISLVIFIITFKKVWPLLYQFQIFIINKFPQFFQSPTNRVAKIIILYLGKINKNIKKQIYWCLSFSLNSIRTFLIINQWDLLFKVILCYNHIQINNIRTLLQILFSTLILCSYIYFIFKAFYQCIPKKNHDHKLRLDFNFMVFNFCRTISFHLFLIILQDQFVLQCLSLSINNFSQCIIIYKYFQCNKFEKIALVINEGFLSIFTITQLVYLKQGFFDISSENIVRIGFFHVYLLLFTLAITLIKQCLPIFNKFVQLIRKK